MESAKTSNRIMTIFSFRLCSFLRTERRSRIDHRAKKKPGVGPGLVRWHDAMLSRDG